MADCSITESANTSMPSPTKPNLAKTYIRQTSQAKTENDENSFPSGDKGGLKRNKTSSPHKPRTPIPSPSRGANDNERKPTPRTQIDPLPLPHSAGQSPTSATTDLPNTRTSRRRGAVVSYAEPNLRDKMRRSTNELGPAVSRDRSRKSSPHTDSTREQHGQRKNDSRKKSRNSSIPNAEHDPVGSQIFEMPRITAADRKHDSPVQVSDGSRIEETECSSHGSVTRGNELLKNPLIENVPVEQNATQDNTDQSFNKSNISVDLNQTVSVTNRKSRRHSASTKTTGRGAPSNDISGAFDVEGVCNELANELSKADGISSKDSQEYMDSPSSVGSTGMTRGQRVAARRRSMML